MNSIPLLDLTRQFESIRADVSVAVSEVLASGQYIKGTKVKAFEQHFARYLGVQHCIACNSGTDALFLALRALGIGPGDEVITSPFTFIATAEMITAVGATPVFVDIEASTFNLDVNQVEAAITSHTRAIIPVHLFGQPVDMTQLMAIAQSHNLWVIEDCAQATGASWQTMRVGSIGHIGCFSFYPTKNLGACGDGGAVTTQDDAIATQIRMLADHGRKEGYYHEAIGVNSRLDAVQAVILEIKLRKLDQWNAQRRAIATYYSHLLAPLSDIIAPCPLPDSTHVWHQYTIRLPQVIKPTHQALSTFSLRDRVRKYLHQHGVGSMIYYPLPLHLQPVYASLGYTSGQLSVAEQIACEVLSLPMYPELSLEQQEKVIYILKDALLDAHE